MIAVVCERYTCYAQYFKNSSRVEVIANRGFAVNLDGMRCNTDKKVLIEDSQNVRSSYDM